MTIQIGCYLDDYNYSYIDLSEKFKTGMTKTYAETCKSITSQELLELLRSHDHDAAVQVTNRKEVISKRELNALLDRSALVEQFEGTTAVTTAKVVTVWLQSVLSVFLRYQMHYSYPILVLLLFPLKVNIASIMMS